MTKKPEQWQQPIVKEKTVMNNTPTNSREIVMTGETKIVKFQCNLF